jgi:hypothetical protein
VGLWGLSMERVRVEDIALPETVKRSMSRQAERERRARVVAVAKNSILVPPIPVERPRFLDRASGPRHGSGCREPAAEETNGHAVPADALARTRQTRVAGLPLSA